MEVLGFIAKGLSLRRMVGSEDFIAWESESLGLGTFQVETFRFIV